MALLEHYEEHFHRTPYRCRSCRWRCSCSNHVCSRSKRSRFRYQGWGAWPACSAKLGLYGKAGASATAQNYEAPAAQSQVNTQAQAQESYTAPAAQAPATQAPAQQAPAAPAAAEAPAAQAPAAQAPAATYTAPAAPAAAAGTYTVQAGDTLSGIAAAYGVQGGYTAIAAANPGTIVNVDLIYPGQVLNIPA